LASCRISTPREDLSGAPSAAVTTCPDTVHAPGCFSSILGVCVARTTKADAMIKPAIARRKPRIALYSVAFASLFSQAREQKERMDRRHGCSTDHGVWE